MRHFVTIRDYGGVRTIDHGLAIQQRGLGHGRLPYRATQLNGGFALHPGRLAVCVTCSKAAIPRAIRFRLPRRAYEGGDKANFEPKNLGYAPLRSSALEQNITSPHSLECYRLLGDGPPFYKFGKCVC